MVREIATPHEIRSSLWVKLAVGKVAVIMVPGVGIVLV